jgi:hypothetical protein
MARLPADVEFLVIKTVAVCVVSLVILCDEMAVTDGATCVIDDAMIEVDSARGKTTMLVVCIVSCNDSVLY